MRYHLASPITRALAAAILLGGVVLDGPAIVALAQDPDAGTTPSTGDQPPASAPPFASGEGNAPEPPIDPIPARIKYLHDRLRITPAQAPLWANVAQAMRENANALAPLINARLKSAQSGNAIEVLGTYEKLGEAQVAGLKRFQTAFEALYPELSSQQKKIADTLFRVGPLGMIGGIPELAEDLVAPSPHAYQPSYGEAPPSIAYPPPVYYPPYAYYPPPYAYPNYRYYPYYSPWFWGPPIGFGTSFFFVHRFHHRHVHVVRPIGPFAHAVIPPGRVVAVVPRSGVVVGPRGGVVVLHRR